MPATQSWDDLGRAAAKEANEQLRRNGERDRQIWANEALYEIRDLLTEILNELRKD